MSMFDEMQRMGDTSPYDTYAPAFVDDADDDGDYDERIDDEHINERIDDDVEIAGDPDAATNCPF